MALAITRRAPWKGGILGVREQLAWAPEEPKQKRSCTTRSTLPPTGACGRPGSHGPDPSIRTLFAAARRLAAIQP